MKRILTTMPPPKRATPPLQNDETILLRQQGGCKLPGKPGWCVAECILTNKRLLFWQLRRMMAEIPLATITRLKNRKHYYVMRNRDALGICFTHKRSQERCAWLILNGIDIWKSRLFQMALLKVDEALIQRLSRKLDKSCAAILSHLFHHRHARIAQLAEVCHAKNHTEVLMHIRDAINPLTCRTLGLPLLTFEKKRIDPQTQEPVLFSWWMVGPLDSLYKKEQRMVDIFDEGDHFLIILEVKQVDLSDLRVFTQGTKVTIQSLHPQSLWRECIELPQPVSLDRHILSLKHALMSLSLQKTSSSAQEPLSH